MPPAHPPEFRRRAIELARERAKPIAQIAADIGISESCLRTWLHQADVDDGRREGLTTEERVVVSVAELPACLSDQFVADLCQGAQPIVVVGEHRPQCHLGSHIAEVRTASLARPRG